MYISFAAFYLVRHDIPDLGSPGGEHTAQEYFCAGWAQCARLSITLDNFLVESATCIKTQCTNYQGTAAST